MALVLISTPAFGQPPIIVSPPDITVEATAVMTPVMAGMATATDDTDPNPLITSNATSTYLVGNTTIVWTATDAEGNTSVDTQTITVQDTTDPIFSQISDVMVNSSGRIVVMFDIPQATDIFDVTTSCTPASGQEFNVGTTVVTCTATDANQNTTQRTFNVIVSVTDPPTDPNTDLGPITITTTNIVREATAVNTILNPPAPTVTGNFDRVGWLTNDAPILGFPIGETYVTWDVVAYPHERETAMQTVTIQDTTAPVFDATPDIRALAFGTTANVPFTIIATDIFDVTVSCTPASTHAFPIGTTEVSCTATDTNGNMASTTFNVIISSADSDVDLEPPTITATNIVQEATAVNTILTLPKPTVIDNSGVIMEVAHDAPTGGFPLGETRVTWTATDFARNTGTAVQTVTIQDTIAPVFRETPPRVQYVNTPEASIEFYHPLADDIFDVTTSCTPASRTPFLVGATITTCTATDTSGNTAFTKHPVILVYYPAYNRTITIIPPSDITVDATGVKTYVDIGSVPITDDMDPNLTITNNAPGFPLGETIVTWTATAPTGDTVTGTQTITVQDTTPPVLPRLLPDIHVKSSTSTNVEFEIPQAMDLSEVTVVCDPDSGDMFSMGRTIVLCTATDSNGQSTANSFFVYVTPEPQLLAVGSSFIPYVDGVTVSPRFNGFYIIGDLSDTFTLQVSNSTGVLRDILNPTSHDSSYGKSDNSNLLSIRFDEEFQPGPHTFFINNNFLGTVTVETTTTPTLESTIVAVGYDFQFVPFVDGITISNEHRIQFRFNFYDDGPRRNIFFIAEDLNGNIFRIGGSNGGGSFVWKGINYIPAGAYSLSINGVDLGSINIISPDPNLNALDGASGDASGLTFGIQTTNATGIATPIPPTHDTKEHGISGQAE